VSVENPLDILNEEDIFWVFGHLLGPSNRVTLTCGYCGSERTQLRSAVTGIKWFHNHPCHDILTVE
jgi:hypothetical protein